jgi:hypothetical protein
MNVRICTFSQKEWSFKNCVRCVSTSRGLIAWTTIAGRICRLYSFTPWIRFARCAKCHGTVITIRNIETTGLQKSISSHRKIRKWETEFIHCMGHVGRLYNPKSQASNYPSAVQTVYTKFIHFVNFYTHVNTPST